ncbi:hypothetical protein ACFE04_010556 [Oxalis oulophora]
MIFTGHTAEVMSLAFHPKRGHILCSCDTKNEIRFWDLVNHSCLHTSQEATKQVRFQPPNGNLLATASGSHINKIDVESHHLVHCLLGHDEKFLSVCWDPSGRYLASVSENSVRLWTIESKVKCLKELKVSGNMFKSCTFYPGYSLLLVIGAYKTLKLLKPLEIWVDVNNWFERQQQEQEMQRIRDENKVAMKVVEELHRKKMSQNREGEKDKDDPMGRGQNQLDNNRGATY